MQRGRLALLVRERQRQKFVDRIGRVGTEPPEERLPAAVLAQKPRIKGVGREGPGAGAPDGEPPRRVAGALVRRGRERPGERSAAVRCELKEIILLEPDKRRLEDAGEGEIVVRRQRRPANGDKVHHRNVIAQHQPVGAGYFHFPVLQRADHRIEKGVAAANQDHHVARTNASRRAVVADDALARTPAKAISRLSPRFGVRASPADRRATTRRAACASRPDRR